MKLTISQEGSNPITIRTAPEKTIRSEEKISPSEAYMALNNFTTAAQAVALAAAGNPAGLVSAAIYGGIATLINKIASIGNFNSGKEMLASPKLIGKAENIERQYGPDFPSLQEVETSSKTKNKSGFLAWFLGGQASGKKIKDNIRTTDMILKKVGNVPVAIIKLTPFLGSVDYTQIKGQRVLIATAFVRKGNAIKSIPLCRGYLNAGNEVNASRECADIYWSEDGKAHGKKEILKYIKAIRSGESAGPIGVNEAMNIIDELSV